MKIWILLATISAGACAKHRADELAVRITETDHELTIVATGPDGVERGKVHLRTGPFDMQEDGRHVDGRQMDVVVLGQTLHHESEGYHQLSLPFQESPSLGDFNDFLRDPAVRRALDRRTDRARGGGALLAVLVHARVWRLESLCPELVLEEGW